MPYAIIFPAYAQRITTFQVQKGYSYNTSAPWNHIWPDAIESILQLPDKGFVCFGLSNIESGTALNHVNNFHNCPVVFRLDSLGRTIWINRYFYTSKGAPNSYDVVDAISPM